MGSTGKFIFIWHRLGKIYFRVNMVNHSPLRQLLETVMLLKAVVQGGTTKIDHPLISRVTVPKFAQFVTSHTSSISTYSHCHGVCKRN